MNIALIILLMLIVGLLFWALRDNKGAPSRDQVDDETDSSNDATMRRRTADREIEEKFPEDKIRDRHKSGRTAEGEQEEDDHVQEEKFIIPYPADDIISENSRMKVYKRTLMNAEIYAQNNDFNTSISLYTGVHDRVNDANVRHKIMVNIEYLKKFIEKKEKNARKRDRDAGVAPKDGKKEEDIKKDENTVKVSFDGKLPQVIHIGANAPEDEMNAGQLADKIAGQLKDEIAGIIGLQYAQGGLQGLKPGTDTGLEKKPYQQPRVNDAGILQGDTAAQKNPVEYLSDFKNDLNEMVTLKDEIGRIASQENDLASIAKLEKEFNHLEELKDKLGSIKPPLDSQTASTLKQQLEKIISLREKLPDITDLRKDLSDITEIRDKLHELAQYPDPNTAINGINNQIRDISDLKKTIDSVAPPGSQSASLNALRNELSEITNLGQRLTGGGMAPAGPSYADQPPPSSQPPSVRQPLQTEEIISLKNELRDLKDTFGEIKHAMSESSTRGPSISPAKFEGPVPSSIDSKPIIDLLSKIPDQISQIEAVQGAYGAGYAAAQSTLPGGGPAAQSTSPGGGPAAQSTIPGGGPAAQSTIPGGGPAAQSTSPGGGPAAQSTSPGGGPAAQSTSPGGGFAAQSTSPGGGPAAPGSPSGPRGRAQGPASMYDEDNYEFELMKEFGKDNFGDNMSDEAVFEKILADTKEQENDKSSFEVIGDKKIKSDEFSIADPHMDQRMRDEERFYRNILTTDKRKRRELPILKVTYDFSRLPDNLSLSKDKNIMEYSFYKYKPMLEKANEFIKKRKVRDALNYYKVVMGQNIPPEMKAMIRKNINDLTDYLENYLTFD